MEHWGISWAHRQHPNPPLPITNHSSSLSDSEDGASSDSSYDPTTVMMDSLPVPNPSDSKKRKSTEPNSPFARHNKRARGDARGAPVLGDASIQLPAEVWHHIFTYLSPPTLGRLLLVNKLFNNYLDPASTVKAFHPQFPDPPSLSTVRTRRPRSLYPMLPETIWRSSRRVFLPGMPTPLRTMSELDSWRLACSKFCQFCSFRSQEEPKDRWHRGPGAKGVSPVFPLLMLTCGPCLAAKTVKEVDLLLSSTIPSVLLPALPVALVTSEMHVIAPHNIHGGGPPNPEITKHYSREQIEALKAEFDGVKLLGTGAAEEWFKGLEAKGKSLLLDAARWEKWDNSGGLQRMRQLIAEAQRVPAALQSTSSSDIVAAQDHVNHIKIESSSDAANSTTVTRADAIEAAGSANFRRNKKRTKQEAMELMKRRREEIERRAALLVPPIHPSVLAHMRSFQAAVQLTAPLDDDTWSVLAEKFLEQRGEAELKEHNLREQAKLSSTTSNTGVADFGNGKYTTTDALSKAAGSRDPREVPDDDWDDAQGPVRAKISDYADEIIRDKWDDGEKVNKKACPTFAAQVLLHVRKRFYAEMAKEQSAAVAAGKLLTPDPPEGPWLQKLTLENMKWVFDVKVKPLTNKLRPEMFLCHGCSNGKFFGLEGVIQHYAAKHSESLSLGNIVVFWRAEWPEVPPFMPDPKNPKVHSPQNQPAQSKDPATTTTSARTGLPLKSQQPTTQAHTLPNHGQQQPLPNTTTLSAYGSTSNYQPFHPTETHQDTYPQFPPSAHDTLARSYPAAEHDSAQYGISGPKSPRLNGSASTKHQDERLGFIAAVARETFASLCRVDALPSAVRLCVIIHHIAKSWQNHFKEAAPLLAFEDGLSGDQSMEPLRRMNGLRCKACAGSHSVDLQHTIYSVIPLVKHFRQAHVESGPHPLDWRTEMVSLPSLDVLYDLPRLLAQDIQAYESVADALPWAFAEPPAIATYDSRPPAFYQRQGTVFHQPTNEFYGNTQHAQAPFEQEGRPAGHPQYPHGPVSHAPPNSQYSMTAPESRHDHPHVQPRSSSRAQTRPPHYHPDDPARQNWAAPLPAELGPQHHHQALPSHPHYPQQPPQYAYRDGQESEYETIEVRHPDTGALYHIRRRIHRDPYQHPDGRAQTRAPFEDYRRAGTVAPPARTEGDDYDPRYPGGAGHGRYQ